MRRCSNERLDHLLSTDPTLKLCRHCGVVSCTNPKTAFIEQRISPLPTSYFLSTQMFSDIPSSGDDFRKQNQIGRGGGNKEQTSARLGKYYNVQRKDNRFSRKERMVENGKAYGSREVSLRVKRENNYHLAHPAQRVETMVAERENEDTTQEGSNDEEGKSECARAKNSFKVTSKQICKDAESKEKSRGGKFYAEVQPANKKPDWRAKDDMNGNECNEKILRDIVYETPKSEFGGEEVGGDGSSLMSEKRDDDESATVKVVHGANSSGNVMAYLARGRLEALDGREKEPVSKSGERRHASRYASNERSFVLHNNRERNSEFLIRERLVPKEKLARSYEKKTIRLEPVQNLKQFRSATCLMEDDSLENCEPRGQIEIGQANESNTSMVSSSSAENMIREWVKAPLQRIQDGRFNKSSDTSKPSVIDSKEGRRFWTKEKSVHCGEGWAGGEEARRSQLENNNKNAGEEMEKRSSSKNKYSNRQIISSIVGGFKLWSSKESISNKTSEKGERPEARKSEKRFGKHLFESFKTFKSLRSVRSKNSSENKSSSATCSLSDRVGNVTRKIIYNESSLKNVIDKNGNYGRNKMEDVLLLYRKVLESTEEMDWRSFQRFVENLHPSKRNLWRDICKIIDEKLEVTRGDDKSAEICIEITSTPFEDGKRKERREESSNEIVFEMDITLGDMERCLGRQLSSTEEEQLDTLKEPSQVIQVRNGEVCDIEEDSNQAE